MNKPEDASLIDHHFDVWLESKHEPSDKQKAAEKIMETLSEERRDMILDYVFEVRKQAYYAGFATGVMLMQDCREECRKIK